MSDEDQQQKEAYDNLGLCACGSQPAGLIDVVPDYYYRPDNSNEIHHYPKAMCLACMDRFTKVWKRFWTPHQPTQQELIHKQELESELKPLILEFKNKYNILQLDEQRVKAYGEDHRDKVSLGDITDKESRLRARGDILYKQIRELEQKIKTCIPQYDDVVFADG